MSSRKHFRLASLAILTPLLLSVVLVPAEEFTTDSLDSIIAQLADEKALPLLRRNAARTVIGMGRPAAKAIPVLISILSNRNEQDDYIRSLAAEALGSIGEPALIAVPCLILVLRDPPARGESVRCAAAKTFGQLGPMAKDGVPALSAVLGNTNESVDLRIQAAISLGKIGPVAVKSVPILRSVAEFTSEPALKRNCVLALGKLGYQARSAIPFLSDLLLGSTTDPDQFICTSLAFSEITRGLPEHRGELGAWELHRTIRRMHAVRLRLLELGNTDPRVADAEFIPLAEQIGAVVNDMEAERKSRFPFSFIHWLLHPRQGLEGSKAEVLMYCSCVYLFLFLPAALAVGFVWGCVYFRSLEMLVVSLEKWRMPLKLTYVAKRVVLPAGRLLNLGLGLSFSLCLARMPRTVGKKIQVKLKLLRTKTVKPIIINEYTSPP